MQSIKVLDKIRIKMKAENVDALIIPTFDIHQSEYVAKHWQSIPWLSGFTGSAATIVITSEHAGLWTDSRYFIQAEQELSTGPYELHKLIVPHTDEHMAWITKHLNEGTNVAIEGDLFSINKVRSMEKKLKPKNIKLKLLNNFFETIWEKRPNLPKEQIFELNVDFAGESRKNKLHRICDIVLEREAHYYFANTLDDVAWIFNLRGSDIDYNPVFLAFALISKEETYLFLDKSKLENGLEDKLHAENIKLLPYDNIREVLSRLEKKVILDGTSVSAALYNCIDKNLIVEESSIASKFKGVKNKIEIENTRQAMIKDGVALTKLYRWLEQKIQLQEVSEVEVEKQLAAFRAEQESYFGESFGAIVGFKGNGAIVHYHANPDNCAMINSEGMLLLDSGGQYRLGTTDITRTTIFGEATSEQKRNYTAVLKGHIALAQIKFPHGTKGYQIEVLARQFLWDQGLNYGHGTGHGVGYFLNVHEGPQSISSVAGGKASTILEPGMITSNEPGFYKNDEYGIRIENLVLVVEDQKTAFGRFLKFETLTLFPIATDLIDFALLSKNDVLWLNQYHQNVYNSLAPNLDTDERKWLEQMCKEI